jgi:transmembrane sensor
MKKIKDQLYWAGLLVKEVLNTLSPEESAALEDWKKDSDNYALYTSILNRKAKEERNEQLKNIDTTTEWSRFLSEMERKQKSTPRQVRLLMFKRIASVAAVLVLALSVYLVTHIYKQENLQPLAESHIEPGKARAELVLGDGKVVDLEQDTIARISQTGVEIANKKGVLEYNLNEVHEEIPDTNLLRIPRGGEYQLVLPDGTKVWLNSDTQLKYPVRFTGNERRVELSGEAYFEVSHNPEHPFVVMSDHQKISVLGTHFNVSSYSDNENAITTLVEGKVKVDFDVEKAHHEQFLNPDQQLVINRKTNTTYVKEVDTYLYTSWKDGRFVFRNESLEEFMKIIARWYNIDVLFVDEDTKELRFTGDLPRYENLKDVLKIMESEMSVSIKVESNNLIYISK